jgi:protein ImuB
MLKKRILSLWFPRLGVERISRLKSVLNEVPFAIVINNNNSLVLSSLSYFAEKEGLHVGQFLTDAQILCPNLITKEEDIFAENFFLKTLQRWAGKFSPLVTIESQTALILDITGCVNLFGGERNLLNKIEQDCINMKLTVKMGLADTIGAAWALARYEASTNPMHRTGDSIDQEARATRSRSYKRNLENYLDLKPVTGALSPNIRIALPGQTKTILSFLPVSALRLSKKENSELSCLGIHTIKDLEILPRGSIERRFGFNILRRLDQAIGRQSEPISPSVPNTHFGVRIAFPDPIGLEEDIMIAIKRLLSSLEEKLIQNGSGIRRLTLQLYPCDRNIKSIEIGFAQATSNMKSIISLLKLKLEKIDLVFEIDCIRIYANEIEFLHLKQKNIYFNKEKTVDKNITIDVAFLDLISRIGARVGLKNITRFGPAESNIPEKSANIFAVAWSKPIIEWPNNFLERPLHLFKPEHIILSCLERPPKTFRWRSRDFIILYSRGPERIAPEWWLDDQNWRTGVRDYWKIITVTGEALWLYQAHGALSPGGWFCHGNFG